MRPLTSLIRFASICLFLTALCSFATAQNYTATQPDNILTPADPIGIPPQPSTAGTHEAVNIINGGLSFFLPVLSLPQRGGWNLTLGYGGASPNWTLRQDVSVYTYPGGPQGPPTETITYTNSMRPYPGGVSYANLPTLQASIEYTGDAQFTSLSTVYEIPVLCITNFVFTDWSGNKHPFTNVADCSVIGGAFPAEILAQVTDSSDGSWLRLNTTNYNSNITVITKDGTTYNFPGFSYDPFAACKGNGSGGCYGGPSGTLPANTASFINPWYFQTFSSMVDSTGQNTVTYSNGTLTDTIGRRITLGNTGISYTDSNGNSQTIQIAGTQQTAQNYNFSFTCSPGKIPQNVTVVENYGPTSFSLAPSTSTITLPAVNGVSRVYTLQGDGLGNLLQVIYPSGGYTKYDYQSSYMMIDPALHQCGRTVQQIAHKRECPPSSGTCSSSQELVTTYTPSTDGDLPFNDNIVVQDPLGDVTYVTIQNSDIYHNFAAPHETTRQTFPPGQYPSGTPLRTIQTTYTTYEPGVDVQLPASVTTTLNDVSPALSAVTNYQYETVPISTYCISGNCVYSGTQVAIDNQTELDEYDYGNTTTPSRKTAQTWMNSSNGSLYDIAGSHLLDRLASRTITDPATNVQATLSFGYNTVGQMTSKTAGGTNVTSLTTSYQRDAYGNVTQVTDPKGNVTKFGYTDTWAQTTCAPSQNSSAYLTSITDALNHTPTTFSYNSCTGFKASATDPNGARISLTYDALGRLTQANFPDGGQTIQSYVDSTPNSATTNNLVTTGLNRVATAVLDGFGRTIQMQLASDPGGITYGDISYDPLGRVYCASNPYRSTADPTYGITTNAYDALGRVLAVQPPDYWANSSTSSPTCQSVTPSTTPANPSNYVATSYSGNRTTSTDQAGKSRKSQSDALGRLTKVWEDPSGLNYETDYSHDAFSNLTNVTQSGSRQRTFVYNALSQLTSATNPESGTITYAYDPDGNVATKTSPAPNQTGSATITTAYAYDALNRLTGKTYSDGSLPVAYFFDGQTPPSTSSPGNGTVTISGSEQTSPGQQATGTISFSGVTLTSQNITVGGHICRSNFPRGTPGNNMATSTANCLNGTGIVTAQPVSNYVNLTSVVSGTAGNYSLSWSGFSGSISGMSGGTNGTPDSGTVSVTVNGFAKSVPYGSGSAGNTIASALVSAFNGDNNSPVTASSSSNVLTLTAKATGSTSNYSLTANDTYNTQLFQGPSFVPASFGFSLTNGCNADSITMTYGIGRRTGMCDAAGAEAWTYDSMGRVLSDHRNTNSVILSTNYTYNLDGSVATLTYPSSRVITYTLASSGTSTAGRLASAVDNANSISYATGASYGPSGALASLANGANLTSTLFFNPRLQPCRVSVRTGGVSPSNCTDTSNLGNVLDYTYGFNFGSGNNGNVVGITNNRDNTRSQNFTYDSLNRLSTAATQTTGVTVPNANCWGLTFGYDAWGNLLQQTTSGPSGCSEPVPLNAYATTKNQLSTSSTQLAGYCYDAVGNLILNSTCPTGSFTPTYSYNAQNQLTSTANVTYTYDGDGRRVQKSNGILYWYGTSSDPLDETDLAGNNNNSSFKEYVFFNGMRTASRDYQNNVNYYFTDHIGTSRVVTNSSGSILDDSDFYPFGGERPSCEPNGAPGCTLPIGSGNHYKFTGKEHDSESNLDYFGARLSSASLGRFISPDDPFVGWEGLDPQTLNLYSYVGNNPPNSVDEDGHQALPAMKCDSLMCWLGALLQTIFGSGDGGSSSSSNGDIRQLHWSAYSTNPDTGQNPAVDLRIPGTNLTNGQFIRGTDELMGQAAEALLTIEELFDPTGMYATAVGHAAGMRSNSDLLLSIGLAHLLPAGVSLEEAKTLVGGWAKATFDSVAQNISHHFEEHGAQVGAKNVIQYMRKAEGFMQNLKGAAKRTVEHGNTRYTKSGRYIILDKEGKIVSFGPARH